MYLLKDGFFYVRWWLAVVRAFMRVRPVTTTSVVILSIIARITGLLATFLPLKVVILAGSSGVPRYFRAFMGSGDKIHWIIILSAAAVLCYILTLVIDHLVKQLSEKASMDVLSGANEMAVASKMRSEAQTYYSRFMLVSSSSTFGFLGVVAVSLLNSTLFTVLLVLVLAEVLFTSVVLRRGDPLRPGRLMRWIQGSTGEYLSTLSSINFLVGFLAILGSYLFGSGGGNILLAILSIIILRQCFSAIASAIKELVSLARRRAVINPLVFRQQTVRPNETHANRTLRKLFRKVDRDKRAAREIRQAIGQVNKVSARWKDSRIVGVSTFVIEAVDPENDRKLHFQQQVFPVKNLHLIENEEFLFNAVSRTSLHAPDVIARFSEGPFECQICEYGNGKEPSPREWPAMLKPLLLDLWSFKPPVELVSAFNTAKSQLSGRLDRALISRLTVATDSPDERKLYKNLMRALPQIVSALDEVPLYIHNPDFTRANIAVKDEGGSLVMTWGRWTIAPIATKFPDSLSDDELAEMLREVGERRDDLQPDVTANHLKLVSKCYELEKHINKEEFKAALRVARAILRNPAIMNEEAEPGSEAVGS